MVRGNPRDKSEADHILDNVVRQTFIFLSKNPTHIARQQPEAYQVSKQHDKELTAELVRAGLLSDGYVAVLSGTPTEAGDKFNGGKYSLVVHTVKGKHGWEDGRVNVNLSINLRPGAKPGIENAVGEYSVGPPLTVIFEELNSTWEQWAGKETRLIEIAKSAISPIDTQIAPDDILAYQSGKKPLDKNSMPIPDSLFPGARSRLSSHPKGTRYEADQYQIACYFPK